MLTDLVQIGRLTERAAEENLGFRRYLRAHHISDDHLRKRARRILDEFDCTSCSECCRRTRVQVSAAEIEAIAAELCIDRADVRRLYTEHGQEKSETLLRQVNDQCVFLHRNLCLVYESRPHACRHFPAIAEPQRSLGARMASVCRQAGFCPVVYNALEDFKKETGFC